MAANNARAKLVILISGRGSNMVSIMAAIATGRLNADIVAVISNRANAAGLTAAAADGIATAVVDHTEFESRDAFDRVLADTVDRFKPDLVVLAGFMRILTADFVTHFNGKLLNIHPSLLPKF